MVEASGIFTIISGLSQPSVRCVTVPSVPRPAPPPPVSTAGHLPRSGLCGAVIGWLSGARWQLDRGLRINKKQEQEEETEERESITHATKTEL